MTLGIQGLSFGGKKGKETWNHKAHCKDHANDQITIVLVN